MPEQKDEPKVIDFLLIEDITRMSPLETGEAVGIECVVEGKTQFYAISPENALQMAVQLFAGAKGCGVIQLASSEEKAAPDFKVQVLAIMDDASDEMTLATTGGMSVTLQ